MGGIIVWHLLLLFSDCLLNCTANSGGKFCNFLETPRILPVVSSFNISHSKNSQWKVLRQSNGKFKFTVSLSTEKGNRKFIGLENLVLFKFYFSRTLHCSQEPYYSILFIPTLARTVRFSSWTMTIITLRVMSFKSFKRFVLIRPIQRISKRFLNTPSAIARTKMKIFYKWVHWTR